MKYRPEDDIIEGRKRDPIEVCRQKLIELGDLTGDSATAFMAEHKSAGEASNDDFPPEVVALLTQGIESAMAAAVPDGEEGAQWVFFEGGNQ
jgi:TPP-dependent pyruvate/acetoin dehydrogenase alpha subunit